MEVFIKTMPFNNSEAFHIRGFFSWLLFLFAVWKQRCAGEQVFIPSSYQSFALSASTSLTDLIFTEAYELCLLSDDHDLAVLFDWKRGNGLSGFFGRLHVDNADATTFC